MKKTFVGIAVLCMIGLLGCSNVLDGSTGTKTGAEDPADLARVLIPLPKTGARNIEEAQTNTNLFEAIFYRYGTDGSKYVGTYNATATPADEYLEISLAVGTYDVLVLVGDQYSSQEYFSGYNYSEDGVYYAYPVLLASGSAEEQTVSAGENTITITLLSVDYSLGIPSTVDIGSTYEVSVQYTLRNSFLWNRAYYLETYLYSTNDSGNSTSLYNQSVYYGDTDREGVKTKQNAAPITTGTRAIRGYTYFSSNLYSLKSWRLFDSSHPTYGNRIPSITFVDAELPSLKLAVTWGDE
ncbi:MAG: hypothetical protein LBL76_04890 [Treponema sp.]|jgi:hypothetical protein|nr:hypothetical protein [Treponema sp.]